MKPRLIAFDFDGTIANTLGEMHRIFNEMAPEFGLREVHKDEVKNLRHLSVKKLLKELQVPKHKVPTLLATGLRILRSRIEHIELIEGMREALMELRPKVEHFGILTSNSSENVELFLKRHNLEELFHFVSCKSKLSGKAKNLKSIQRTFSLEKNEMLYVGDELRDVKACQKAGIPIAAVTWGFNTRESLTESKPEFLLDHPKELVELIGI